MPKIYDYLGIVFFSIQTNMSRYTFTRNTAITRRFLSLFLMMEF